MDIYIKPVKKTELTGRKEILTGDIAEIIASEDAAEKIKNLRLMRIETLEKKKNYLISCTDIIKAITASFPGASVINVGEMDTVVQYAAEKKKENAAWTWIKVLLVVMILVTGSATALMSFHTDSQVPKVFENYYKIFYGHENADPLIIDISYSIGLAAGIIVFYNHLLGKKLTSDPTPIEVEMSQYDAEVTDTVLDILSTKKNENESS